MADNPTDSFLVEIGFTKPDAAGARAQEDLVNRTEARITETQAREGAKRTSAETKAQGEAVQRINRWFAQRNEAEEKDRAERAKATAEFFGDMLGLDKDQSAALLKQAKVGSTKAVEVEHERAKKVSQIRAGQFKEAEAGLLRFAGFASALGTGLSTALSAAPFGALLTGIERGASGLARLDIQAKRVGSSAAGIQRFLFAMKQQGVDEGEATGALEGFASTMKSNPKGYRQALERLPGGGVRTLGKDGKPLGYDEMLENFEGYLARQPFNIARIQAGQFGITGDNAIAALQDPGATRKGLAAYDAKLREFGFDPNKAAADAREVQKSWDNLEANFKIIKQKLDAEFFIPFMNSLDAIAKKMEQNPQAVESFGRGLEALAVGLSARVLPVFANLGVKLAGLAPILGTSVGAALGIAVNPVVLAGASAESTPGAGVPADAAERAKVAAENRRLTDEANRKQGSTGSFWADSWNYIKGKVGLGDDDKVKRDIATTAEGVKKLADSAGIGGAGAGGDGGGGGSILGAARRTLRYVGMGGGGDQTHIGSGGKVGDLSHNPNATKENADAIRETAKDIGTTPEDLATVISYESAGSFSTGKWGGAGGSMLGLIQFNHENQRKYGIHPGQPFAEQMKAVGQYMKDRGFKPGMGLLDLYSTINAGRPGRYDASDGNGTVRTHVARMQGAHAALARAFLASGGGPAPTATAASGPASTQATQVTQAAYDAATARSSDPNRRLIPLTPAMMKENDSDQAVITAWVKAHPAGPMAHHSGPIMDRGKEVVPGPEVRGKARGYKEIDDGGLAGLAGTTPDKPVKVEVTKADQLAEVAKRATEHAEATKIVARALAARAYGGNPLMPRLHHPLGVTPAMHVSMNNARSNSSFERHGDTFHVHGADVKTALKEAERVSARRESQDRIRYGQG